MWYRNISNSEMTFHGVTFLPGEVKEVNGTINHKDFYAENPPEQSSSNGELGDGQTSQSSSSDKQEKKSTETKQEAKTSPKQQTSSKKTNEQPASEFDTSTDNEDVM